MPRRRTAREHLNDDHATATAPVQRALASSVMGMLLSWVKVANPSSQDRTPRCAVVLTVSPAPAPYRASGLVHWPILLKKGSCCDAEISVIQSV